MGSLWRRQEQTLAARRCDERFSLSPAAASLQLRDAHFPIYPPTGEAIEGLNCVSGIVNLGRVQVSAVGRQRDVEITKQVGNTLARESIWPVKSEMAGASGGHKTESPRLSRVFSCHVRRMYFGKNFQPSTV